MDAATNFRLGVAERSKAKTENPKRPILQRIATGMSLVSFSILGALIIMKRDYAELNGVADGSSIATVGGISAILIGTVFLVTACLYLWVRVRCSVAFPVRPQTARLTLSTAEPAVPLALPS
jgi:hypothetical protein